MRTTALKLASALAAAVAITVALQAPASAESNPTGLTFWSGYFVGTTVSYETIDEGCISLPFGARSHFNDTSATIAVYETTNCSGVARTFGPTDFHNYPAYTVWSVKAAS